MAEEKEAGTRKRQAQLPSAGDFSLKKPKPLFSDGEEYISEEELTRLLEGPDVVPFKVTFVPYPYTWQSISPPPSSYITINVENEESCGSSFSVSECSVMASIDLAGLNLAGLRIGEEEEKNGWIEKNYGAGSWDWDDLDEALANFIGN